jgi:hypothetical protein
MIDELYEMKLIRADLVRKADLMKTAENTLRQEILRHLKDIEVTAARGAKANFSTSTQFEPNVTDWDKVYSFIKDTNDFGLLNKAMKDTTWREYREDGLIVPGTVEFELTKVSLRKI